MTEPTKKTEGGRTVGRVLKALELFSKQTEPVRLTDVARTLELPASSAYALLQELTRYDYVRSLEAAAAVLTITVARQCEGADRADDAVFIAAIRDADLLLRHLASSEALATAWSQCEGPAVR